MLNYQSQKPSNDFLMLENEVITSLTPNALILYIHLRKLQSNEDNSACALIEKTGLTKNALKGAKKELVEKKYLDTKQLFGNKYALYIGKSRVDEYTSRHKKSYNRIEKHQISEATK